MPHFSGYYRQSDFGALAAGIGRVALPLPRKFIWPTAKTRPRTFSAGRTWVGRSSNEKKSVKQALKSTEAKAACKQISGSLQSRIRRGRQAIRRRTQQFAKPRGYKNAHFKKSFLKNHSQEGVDWIFTREWKMQTYIVIHSKATHSSLDLFANHLWSTIRAKNRSTLFPLWIIAQIWICRRSQQFHRFAENLFGSKMSNTKCWWNWFAIHRRWCNRNRCRIVRQQCSSFIVRRLHCFCKWNKNFLS